MPTSPKKNSSNSPFGNWVKRKRGERDLTHDALALMVGCAYETVRKVESGRRRPSRQLATLLAAALGASKEEIPALVELARAGSDEESGAAEGGSSSTEDDHAAAGASHRSSPSMLPASRTGFIGREDEIERVRRFLTVEDHRLVTLVGPPGIGKTRLAIQVASQLSNYFRDGVLFVPLSLVGSPERVLPAIAQALGVKEVTGQPLKDALRDYLRHREMLLLLDNFEHVIPAAPLLGDLLTDCPFLKVLVTSRTVLHVYGEQEFQVPSLSLPNAGEIVPVRSATDRRTTVGSGGQEQIAAQRFEQYESVQLFVQRAQAVSSHFTITPENASTIAQICVQLDGIPLAIELAAARCKLLPPEQILARLDKKLKLLTAASMDLPERQQTLRGAIDWSYDLLKQSEKVAFRRLAVFEGGATLDAMEAVCRVPGESDPDILEIMTSLVDKSMLHIQARVDTEGRFWMLLMLREYALERLAATEEQETIARQHGMYYLALAEAAEPHLPGPQRELWLHRLEPELNNIRAALGWWLSERGDPEMALRMAGALHWFWYFSGLHSEGRDWIGKAIAATRKERSAHRARALNAAGRLALIQDDYTETLALLQEAVSIHREHENKRDLAYALVNFGIAWMKRNRIKSTEEYGYIEHGVALFREAGDQWGLAFALDFLADAIGFVGEDYAEAARHKEESLRLYRELEDTWGIASQLSELGYMAVRQGRYEDARVMLEEAVELTKVVGDRWYQAHSTRSLGDVAWQQEDFQRATALYEESLVLYRQLGDRLGEANALRNLGHLAINRGEHEDAEKLYRHGLTIVRKLGNEQTAALFIAALAGVEAARSNLERAANLIFTADKMREASRGIVPPPDLHQYNITLSTLQARLGEDRLIELREVVITSAPPSMGDYPYSTY